MEYINAGHNPPLLSRARQDYEFCIPEAANEQEELFGDNRMVETIKGFKSSPW